MIGSIGPKPPTPVPGAAESAKDAKLRDTARQLEGVFVQQMYKAMRDTVPTEGGVFNGGSGEEMFTGLLDQHLAADTPSQWEHGLSEAIYRHLRAAQGGSQGNPAEGPTPSAPRLVPLVPVGSVVPVAPPVPSSSFSD